MKWPGSNSQLGLSPRVNALLQGSLVVVMLGWGVAVRAGGEVTKTPASTSSSGATNALVIPASVPAGAQSPTRDASSLSPVEALSPAAAAVVKMVEAGVPLPVIQTYIECSTATTPVTETDIITLKQHQVSDELVIALLKQRAQERGREVKLKKETEVRTVAIRRAQASELDPESYEYFQYYYLQPRAAASVYPRLSPYYGPWGAYPVGPLPGYGWRYRGYSPPR